MGISATPAEQLVEKRIGTLRIFDFETIAT